MSYVSYRNDIAYVLYLRYVWYITYITHITHITYISHVSYVCHMAYVSHVWYITHIHGVTCVRYITQSGGSRAREGVSLDGTTVSPAYCLVINSFLGGLHEKRGPGHHWRSPLVVLSLNTEGVAPCSFERRQGFLVLVLIDETQKGLFGSLPSPFIRELPTASTACFFHVSYTLGSNTGRCSSGVSGAFFVVLLKLAFCASFSCFTFSVSFFWIYVSMLASKADVIIECARLMAICRKAPVMPAVSVYTSSASLKKKAPENLA